ncbi:MAG: hypothetical protein WD738_06480 [Pirellulales bacterium]
MCWPLAVGLAEFLSSVIGQAGRMQSSVMRDLGLGKSCGMPGAVTRFAAVDAGGDVEVAVEELFEEVLARCDAGGCAGCVAALSAGCS